MVKGAHANKQEKYFKEVILKLEQAPKSPVGLVSTQSSGPYPRIFDLVGLWPEPENVHFSKLPSDTNVTMVDNTEWEAFFKNILKPWASEHPL